MILVFSILFVNVYSQNRIVEGRVIDCSNDPIEGVSVCQLNSTNCSVTDSKGKFRLVINNSYSLILDFSCIGLIRERVDISDTSNDKIEVTMLDEISAIIDPVRFGNKLDMFEFSFGLDRSAIRFNTNFEFSPQFIEVFNKERNSYYFNTTIGGYYRNIYGSFSFCYSIPSTKVLDSLRISFRGEKLKFKIGYGFSISKLRLILTPNIAFDMLYYRLLTFNESNTISLTQYLAMQQYDLKFTQWMSTIGTDFNFKVFTCYDKFLKMDLYLSFGAGYSISLTKKIKIESDRNKITSNGSIDYENLYLYTGFRLFIF